MLGIPDVAALIGKSEFTTRKLARLGAIPGAKKVGRDWRFRPDAIAKFTGGASL